MAKLGINDVKKKYEKKIMTIPGVVGIGIRKLDDQDAITVLVAERTEIINQQIPQQLKGFPVIIQESGTFHAL